jgi:hypothetical protein
MKEIILFTIFIVCFLRFWFKKYFSSGEHIDITNTINAENNFNKESLPVINGWKLKILSGIINTKFGQRFLGRMHK